MRFDDMQALNGIRAYPDGQVEFLLDNEPVEATEAHVELSYDRPKGSKAIARATATGSRWPSHPHDVLGNADRIYWVDTNSREVNGQWVHATVVMIGIPSHTIGRTYV